jgi:maleylacetate reductase
VDHCVEGICSNEAHAYGDAQALQGLALLVQGLPAVKANPRDLGARLACQQGSWLSMGPLAAGVPMGASHGIGYILGGRYGVHHGYSSCVMLPHVLRWNEPATEERQRQLSAALARPQLRAGDAVAELIADLGLPGRLRDVGIKENQLPAIAEEAAKHPVVLSNPRPIAGPDDIMQILHAAW